MIKLGRKVKDVVTGLEGIATGRAEYFNGCVQIFIEPKVNKDGEVKGRWVDEVQVKDVGLGIRPPKETTKPPMGPRHNAPER